MSSLGATRRAFLAGRVLDLGTFSTVSGPVCNGDKKAERITNFVVPGPKLIWWFCLKSSIIAVAGAMLNYFAL